MEVSYYHAYIDGVDFVFLDSPIFRHRENDIYGGNRVVKFLLSRSFCCASLKVLFFFSIAENILLLEMHFCSFNGL